MKADMTPAALRAYAKDLRGLAEFIEECAKAIADAGLKHVRPENDKRRVSATLLIEKWCRELAGEMQVSQPAKGKKMIVPTLVAPESVPRE